MLNKIHVLITVPLLGLSAACSGGGGGSSDSSADSNVPKSLSYGLPRQSLMTEHEVDLAPSYKGIVATWEVSPELPDGLVLDGEGRITGTPMAVSPEKSFLITGTGPEGSVSASLSLRIARPSSFAYHVNLADGSVTGYSLDAVTGSLHTLGHYRDDQRIGLPEQAVPHPDGRFVYVPNFGLQSSTSNLSIFERVDNRLEPRQPASIGNGPHEMAFSAEGDVAYVTSQGSGEVGAFLVNFANGELTPIGAPLPISPEPQPLAVDPLGRFLFVGSKGSKSVEVIPLDAAGGFQGAAFSFSLNNSIPTAMRVDPTGKYLVVSIDNFELLITFEIASDGTLSVVGTEATGQTPSCMAIHPRGDAVFLANAADDTLASYILDPLTGELDEAAIIVTGASPNWIGLDELGNQLFLTCGGTDEVQVYDIQDPYQPSLERVYHSRDLPRGIGLHITPGPQRPTIQNVYVANTEAGSLDVFDIDVDTGVLTSAGPAVAAGSAPSRVLVDPFGKFAFVSSESESTVRTFEISGSSLIELGSALAVPGNPGAMAIDPAGRTLYVTSLAADIVSSYSIDRSTGALSSVGTVPTGNDPVSVVVDPTGRFLFTANEGSGSIAAYRIDEGDFTGFASGATLGSASGLAVSPSGLVLFASRALSDQVVPLSIDPESGNLTAQSSAGAAGSPENLVVSPSGNRLYAALSGSGDLSRYSIGDSGKLTKLGQVDSGLGTLDLAIDPRGDLLFTVNRAGNDLTVFSIDSKGFATQTAKVPVGQGPESVDLHIKVQ